MDQNLVVWSQQEESKGERKRLIFLGLQRKPIKPLVQGLHCSQRHKAPSRRGEGTGRLLERVLEGEARKWAQWASVLQRISLRERGRERHGDQSSDETKVFYSTLCGYLYCLTRQLFSAAATAKSLQSCLTLCDPRDGSPPGSPIPGILQARILEWGAISFSILSRDKIKTYKLSRKHEVIHMKERGL